MGRAHHGLRVWQLGMQLTEEVYLLTQSFPISELYGLTSQMRRAAVSVPSNIAEGAGRESDQEFTRFLIMARGSLSELETQCLIAQRLGYIQKNETTFDTIEQTFRQLGGLINSIKKRTLK
jgi:four helix bundle protein